MATVFDVFKEIPYQLLEIKQSSITGDTIISERTLQGIFKERSGEVQSGNMESVSSSSTLHVHPSDFNSQDCSSLIGQGVRVNGVEYSITGATAGRNFDDNTIEHFRLTLQKAKFTKLEADNE